MEEKDLPRPYKHLDSRAVEEWFSLYYYEIIDEWECNDVAELIDFWDWVSAEYPDEMDEFEHWFREQRR